MKRWRLFAVFAALVLIAAACGSDSTETAEPTDETTTEEPEAEEPEAEEPEAEEPEAEEPEAEEPAAEGGAGSGGNLLLLQWQAPSQANAYLSTGTKDLLAGSLVLEPLAEWSPAGELLPALAAEIPTQANGGISDDLTQVTWTLQDGLLWADGTPVTADDVVFTWEYCIDELTGCSSDAFTTVVDVTADDDTHVTVTFDSPSPFPFTPFVGYTNPVLQRAQFADCVGEAAKSCTDQNFQPVGTGPYVVTELRAEDTVLYEVNPNYRHAADGKPFFSTVEIKGGGDAEASARSVLEIGEADFAWNLQVAPEILGPMEDAGNGTVVVAFTSNVEHINLNQTNPDGDPPSDYNGGANPNPFFFENVDLHRALSIAINRDELVAVGYGPNGSPTCNIWPVGAQSTNNDWCLTQDLDEANRILEEDLGYVDSDGDGVRELPDGTPLEFDYVTSTNAVRQSNQDLIKSYWEQIGVNVNMLNEDASLFFDGTNASDVSIWKFFTDIEMFTNGAVAPEPLTYLNSWQTEEIPESTNSWGGGNIVRLASAEYDALFTQLSSTPLDDPGRDDLVVQMNDIISAGSGSTIPLINRGNVSAFSNSIQGQGELNGWDSEYYNIEDWTKSE